MSDTPTPLPTLAASLTEAQRRLVLWHQPNPDGSVSVHTGGVMWRAADVLRRKGLIVSTGQGWARLSETGLALRAHLLERADG